MKQKGKKRENFYSSLLGKRKWKDLDFSHVEL